MRVRTKMRVRINLGVSAVIAVFVAPAILAAQVTNSLPNGPGGLVIQGSTSNNSIEEHFPDPPVGTLIFTLNPGCPFYQVNQLGPGGWSDPNQRLVPGQGVLTWNPAPATNLVSTAMPVSVGQYPPAQWVNLLGLLPEDPMPVGVEFDTISTITVRSNRWQVSEAAILFSDVLWFFADGDESTLRNGTPLLLQTFDPSKPLGNCPSNAVGGEILLNSYAPASSTTGSVTVGMFYPQPILWSQWRAQLYGAISNEGPFGPIGPAFALQGEGLNGKVVLSEPQAIWIGGTRPGQEVILELRVWNTAYGGSYEAADLASSYGTGRSPECRIVAQSDLFLPPTPVNLNQFSVLVQVPLTPPLEIVSQPSSRFVATGAVAMFESSVVSSFFQDVTLQWQNLSATGIWSDLPGQTAATLTFPAASKANQGDYRLRATARSVGGSTTVRISQVAQLRVANPSTLGIVRSSDTVTTLSINVDPEYVTTIDRYLPSGGWETWTQVTTGSSTQTLQLEPQQPLQMFRARTFFH